MWLDFAHLYYSDIRCEEVAHLLRMYQIVSDLQLAEDSREDTNTLMRVLFDEDDTDEMNINVVYLLLASIKDFDEDEIFIHIRDEIKNYIIVED